MEAGASFREPSGNDALALRLLRTNTWSCYCGLALWGFTPERLKEIMLGMLSDLPDSAGRKPRLLSRPCNVLGVHDRTSQEAFFCVAGPGSQKPHAAGLVHSDEEVSLVFLSGTPTSRAFVASHLGSCFGVTLYALLLAPWQLSMAMVWGRSCLELEETSEEHRLEVNMDGIILGFSCTQVLSSLPRSRSITADEGRNLLLALCKHAAKAVLGYHYQELRLCSVHFLNLFFLDHEGTMRVHKNRLVPEFFKFLLTFAKQAVLSTPPDDLEEE